MKEFAIICLVILSTLIMMWLQTRKLRKHHPKAVFLIYLFNLIDKDTDN
jgi:hypothetical protein